MKEKKDSKKIEGNTIKEEITKIKKIKKKIKKYVSNDIYINFLNNFQ